MGILNMEEVLAALEDNNTPEESFAAGLQDDNEKVASAYSQETGTPETPAMAGDYSQEDVEKVAQADAEGRIMAQGFWDELQKVAVAPVAAYPADPGAIPANPAVEVAKGEFAQPHAEGVSKVNAMIAQLTAAGKVGAGEIGTPAGVMPEAHTDPQDGNAPLAVDQAKAQEAAASGGQPAVKTGAVNIVNYLYEQYFGEEA